MREIAIVTRGGEVMMIGGGSSGLGRLLTYVKDSFDSGVSLIYTLYSSCNNSLSSENAKNNDLDF